MKNTLSHLAAFVLGVLVGGLLVTKACPPTPAPASQPSIPSKEKTEIESSKEVEKKDGEVIKSKEETKTSIEVAPKVSSAEVVK